MAVDNSTIVVGSGTAYLSVDSAKELVHWAGLHYSLQPPLTEGAEKALAIICILFIGTVCGGLWWVARAVVLRWLKKHGIQIQKPTPPGA